MPTSRVIDVDPTLNGEALYRNSALVARSSGRRHDAIELLKKSLEFNPKSFDSNLYLGITCEELGRCEEAVEALSVALEVNPESHEALSYYGSALGGLRRFDEALSSIEKALELKPQYPEAHYKLGGVFHQQGRFAEAIEKYRRAIELRADHEQAYNDMGVALQELNRLDEGAAALKRALELKEDYTGAYLNLGVILVRQGKLDEAATLYQKALKIFPKYHLAHHNLGNVYRDQGQIQKAIDHYRTALRIKPDFAMANVSLALAYRKQGRNEEAIKSLKKAIESDPRFGNAYATLAQLYKELGRDDEAVGVYDSFLDEETADIATRYRKATYLHELGRFDKAIEVYEKICELEPAHIESHNDWGAALRALGRVEESIARLFVALEVDPNYVAAHLNMGVAFMDLGRPEEAEACYEKALEIDPRYAPAHHNLGNVLMDTNRVEMALEHYMRAIEANPQYLLAYLSLGVAFGKLGKTKECIEAYKSALAINPNYPEVLLNLGSVYHSLGMLKEAQECYDRCVKARPTYPEAYNNFGFLLNEMGRHGEAIASLERALEFRPNYADAHLNMAYSYYKQDLFEKAYANCNKALELRPDSPLIYRTLGLLAGDTGEVDESINHYLKELHLRADSVGASDLVKEVGSLILELRRLPILYFREEEIKETRDRFMGCLDKALSLVADGCTFTEGEVEILRTLLVNTSNFYLAYQIYNDKELQCKFAELTTRILNKELSPYLNLDRSEEQSRRIASRSKIRVGLASSSLGAHHGSYWAFAWLANLPREDYEFFLYSLNGVEDEVTHKFATLGTYKWLPFSGTNYLDSCRTIKNDELDILFIPDVGMTGQSKILSLTRMAPIQCVSWGHPITTGSKNMDFYLSSDLMEAENADEHYSERLVRLPNTMLYFDEPRLIPDVVTRADFGIPDGKVLYGSVQSLFKYLPQYDYIYPAIAKQVPDAFFVFVGNKSEKVNSMFEQRMRACFEKEGVDYDKHVKMLHRLPFDRFMKLMDLLDVYVDSIGWTGGITTMRAIGVDLPVVTIPGEFMRGRHSYAMLKAIDYDELITDSLDEFLALCVKLGQDRKYHESVVENLRAKKHKLFYDKEPIEYLDRFFKAEVEKVRKGS